MKTFENTPNIGKELAKKLALVEINSPQELSEIGSKDAFLKIKTIFPQDACINMLYALEGAIQEIRWHKLNKLEKANLLAFYNSIKSS